MTVLSRGARVRRSGRRPGWVLLTMLLVLAIGASSALVFTDRVELLKLAVILALWAAVAGAFVSVMYRRQADIDQARARDLKLVYDLQLDREIAARREYELSVESQLRRELAVELRAAAADEIAALRAELSSLRTNLEILFDADLEHRPALETPGRDVPAARALADRYPNGAQPSANPPADWVPSDRVTAVRQDEPPIRPEDAAIIDVPEVGVPPREREMSPAAGEVPPRQTAHAGEPTVNSRHRAPAGPPGMPPPPEPPPGPQPAPAPMPPPVPPMATPVEWQPVPAEGQWLPPGTPGSNWADRTPEPPGLVPPAAPPGRRRRRYSEPPDEVEPPYGAADAAAAAEQYGGRRSRSRHSTEYREFGVGSLGAHPARSRRDRNAPPPEERPEPRSESAAPPPPRLAPAPAPPASRHRGEQAPTEPDGSALHSDGQSVADLMARLQVQPSGGGRRRRRDG